jgi:hypothetical protein
LFCVFLSGLLAIVFAVRFRRLCTRKGDSPAATANQQAEQ